MSSTSDRLREDEPMPDDRAPHESGREHFLTVESASEAEPLVGFHPRLPTVAAGWTLESMRVFVRDHRLRDVPLDERVIEADYGAFVVSQSRPGEEQARSAALSARYGPMSRPTSILGNEGRRYELGPEVPDDDPDGRAPAVLTWYDGGYFYLIASTRLEADALVAVAESWYRPQTR